MTTTAIVLLIILNVELLALAVAIVCATDVAQSEAAHRQLRREINWYGRSYDG